MKIIFSRKGFDDAYGRMANAILPDGKLLVFPIPERHPRQGRAYALINGGGETLDYYLTVLGADLPPDSTGGHLDPDLDRESVHRHPDWRPIFGSHGAANSHLLNEGVGPGDLFLFFGTFKPLVKDSAREWCFSNDPPVHILFGWLRVGAVIHPGAGEQAPGWAKEHPHVVNDYGPSNSLYLSALHPDGQPDAGMLEFRSDRVLSRGGFRKSQWQLPAFFHPSAGTRISRHRSEDRFHFLPGSIMLETVSIGQDFVVTGDDRLVHWALDRISQ